MTPWTDAEIHRFVRREATFIAHGLAEHTAERLAQSLLLRDRPEEGDDRRVCWECDHFTVRNFRCQAREACLPFVMQRCPSFLIKGNT